jgi:hypothetical protein
MNTDKKSALNINSLVPIVLILIILAIVVTFGQNILSSFKSSTCAGGTVLDPTRNVCASCPTGYSYNQSGGVCSNITDPADSEDFTTSNTYELNSTLAGQQGLDTVAQKQNMIALIVVVAVIIGILVTVLYVKNKQE